MNWKSTIIWRNNWLYIIWRSRRTQLLWQWLLWCKICIWFFVKICGGEQLITQDFHNLKKHTPHIPQVHVCHWFLCFTSSYYITLFSLASVIKLQTTKMDIIRKFSDFFRCQAVLSPWLLLHHPAKNVEWRAARLRVIY